MAKKPRDKLCRWGRHLGTIGTDTDDVEAAWEKAAKFFTSPILRNSAV